MMKSHTTVTLIRDLDRWMKILSNVTFSLSMMHLSLVRSKYQNFITHLLYFSPCLIMLKLHTIVTLIWNSCWNMKIYQIIPSFLCFVFLSFYCITNVSPAIRKQLFSCHKTLLSPCSAKWERILHCICWN